MHQLGLETPKSLRFDQLYVSVMVSCCKEDERREIHLSIAMRIRMSIIVRVYAGLGKGE